MIHIVFKEPDTADWKNWRRDCQEAAGELVAAVKRGQEPKVTDLYKRRSIKDQVYLAKDGPFHGKCAYCECDLGSQHGDIEHFRPKKAVTDENDIPVLVKDKSGKLEPHPGYYWLACDWQNLLPSCVTCNRPKTTTDGKKIGKRNRFPVEGIHATEPGALSDEKPLLINPVEEKKVSEHLSIDVATGDMDSHTPRGDMCIQVFGLNLHDHLRAGRQQTIICVKAKLYEVIHNPDRAAKQKALDELEAIKAGKQAYTAAARAVLDDVRPFLEQLLSV